MNPVTYDILTQRVKNLANLPAMPAILSSLTEALSFPPGKIDIDHIVESISYDECLAGQVLRLANSALFRQRGDVATVREAVIALGLWRIRDLAFSSTIPFIFPNLTVAVGKEVFWRHAFGTAAVSQQLGAVFATGNQEQTYLCGLLHDIGILVNCLLFPDDFGDVLEEAVSERVAIEISERRILGFTHAETGRILAEKWRLPLLISETIEFHHHPADQEVPQQVTALVHTADLFCQRFGLGYGYELTSEFSDTQEHIWSDFCRTFPRAKALSPEEFSSLVASYIEDAKIVADEVFGEPVGSQSSTNR